MSETLNHAGTVVTIEDDGTTTITRSGVVEVMMTASGHLDVQWHDPRGRALPRTRLDAGPDSATVMLTLPSNEALTMDSGFRP